jgi:hypothetical protein
MGVAMMVETTAEEPIEFHMAHAMASWMASAARGVRVWLCAAGGMGAEADLLGTFCGSKVTTCYDPMRNRTKCESRVGTESRYHILLYIIFIYGVYIVTQSST